MTYNVFRGTLNST